LGGVIASGFQMRMLSILRLSSNRLSDEALTLLSKGFSQTGCRLTELELDHNNFGREGAQGALNTCLSPTIHNVSHTFTQHWEKRY